MKSKKEQEIENKLNVPVDRKIDKYGWNFENQLGQGAFGKVYLGKDMTTNEAVAVKIYAKDLITKNNLDEQIKKEVQLMREIKSENVVFLVNCFETEKNIYIVQEFCNSGDLSKYMETKKNIPEAEALDILGQMVKGLHELILREIAHRDIKPDNIFMHERKDGKIIYKIGDFGFAKHIPKQSLMQSILGTPLYMSPQIMKNQNYTSKCDIWSLGAIYYEMLYAKSPWKVTSLVDLRNDVMRGVVVFPSYPIVLFSQNRSILSRSPKKARI